jgi:hypothetical protein
VAAVRARHTYLYPASTQMTKETKALKKKGTGPFSQFDFDYFDNKLCRKNKSYDTSIKAGSEVIAVNGISMNLIQEYNRYYSSDGYNTLKLLLGLYFLFYGTKWN